jgi:hypothetical protein
MHNETSYEKTTFYGCISLHAVRGHGEYPWTGKHVDPI